MGFTTQSYKRLQSLSGFVVGDRVKIVSTPYMMFGEDYEEKSGWHVSWNKEPMDATFGSTTIVHKISEDSGIECSNGWWYPFYCLENLSMKEVRPSLDYNYMNQGVIFEEGDIVAVTKIMDHEAKLGWPNVWPPAVGSGMVGRIMKHSVSQGWPVYFPELNDWFYMPWYCLREADMDEIEEYAAHETRLKKDGEELNCDVEDVADSVGHTVESPAVVSVESMMDFVQGLREDRKSIISQSVGGESE